MADDQKEKDQASKTLRESLYQKKAALQEIYETAMASDLPPEEQIQLVIKLAKVSGVYVEKTGY